MPEQIIGANPEPEFKRTLMTTDASGNPLEWWFAIRKDGTPQTFKLTAEGAKSIMAGLPFFAYHPLIMAEQRPVYMPGSFNTLEPWWITDTYSVVAQTEPEFAKKLDAMLQRTFDPPVITEAGPGEAAAAAKAAERQRSMKLVK